MAATTRYSRQLPSLHNAFNLLYTGRLLLRFLSQERTGDPDAHAPTALDERLDELTQELITTELLHQAALLAGDVDPPDEPATSV